MSQEWEYTFFYFDLCDLAIEHKWRMLILLPPVRVSTWSAEPLRACSFLFPCRAQWSPSNRSAPEREGELPKWLAGARSLELNLYRRFNMSTGKCPTLPCTVIESIVPGLDITRTFSSYFAPIVLPRGCSSEGNWPQLLSPFLAIEPWNH